MNESLVDKLTALPDFMRLYQQECAILEVTELVCELMDEQDVSHKELADRLGETEDYIDQILDGTEEMTLRAVSDLLFVLGRSLEVTAVVLTVNK